ncbi:hypothetical protein [Nitrobacter sp. 62-13]|uniref:hypothetical protein n=1 Tax=Nitrobacter sp. 62-13 TaxID=1895797 RepID=UPI000B2F193E|nr:hypothetical protein [Nitrobacter sp. 62-13]
MKTGSREENASNKNLRVPLLFPSEAEMLDKPAQSFCGGFFLARRIGAPAWMAGTKLGHDAR